MWLTGDLARSLKHTNYLITETNAQSIGWDSRTQYPFYPGQLRLAVYTNLAAGANMVEYWHWSSLHYGQETYWKGVLSHDLQPNRTYAEVSRVAGELKRLGPQLANLEPENKVAILFSADSANALSYMRFSDRVSYMTILRQMYNTLCSLNVEPDFVQVGDENLGRYKVLLIPPLYSASDPSLQQISDYVRNGGHVLMEFKSGFTNEYSTVRDMMAPGPLREAAGFHYQEFANLASPQKLTPDAYQTGDQNTASVWQEFLVPDTATVIESLDDPHWHFPSITRNNFGKGTLTYEATYVTDALQHEIIRSFLESVGLTGPDQNLPAAVRVRHGRSLKRQLLHYYFNFSGSEQRFSYPYASGIDLLTNNPVAKESTLELKPWDLAIVSEQ
jgi:beta-galactosidase